MHDPYDDDDYDDDQYDHDHPTNNHYQWYYKFDIGPDTPISKWMDDLIKDIINGDSSLSQSPDIKSFKFPVNGWNPNTVSGNTPQYLGSNYYNEPIWKSKYFIYNPLDINYKSHLQQHAAHFLKQPKYYKGLFEILN